MTSFTRVVFALLGFCNAFAAVLPRQYNSNTSDVKSPLYWFAFGDSYTTTLFDTNGAQPSPSDPMGNPPLGQGTWAGGPNYVGWLTTSLNKSIVETYDFAWPGGTTSNSIIENPDKSIHSFEEQVNDYFEPNYTGECKQFWNSDNAIFSVFIGINDIGLRKDDADISTTIPKLLDKWAELVDKLYQHGARRFLFIGIPPLDRSGMIKGWGADKAARYSDWVNAYNGQISTRIGDFVSSHAGTTSSTFDYHHWMQQVLDNPTPLGFQDADCVDRSGGPRCIWWDDYHVGSIFNLYMAIKLLPALDNIGVDGRTPTPGNTFFR